MHRVVGFEVEAESRAISEFKIEGDKCSIQSDMEKKEPQPLLINEKGKGHNSNVFTACSKQNANKK